MARQCAGDKDQEIYDMLMQGMVSYIKGLLSDLISGQHLLKWISCQVFNTYDKSYQTLNRQLMKRVSHIFQIGLNAQIVLVEERYKGALELDAFGCGNYEFVLG